MRRTVQKDGANKGRQFHTCPKPREEQCGYFLWADEVKAAPTPAQRQNGFQNGWTGGHSGGQTGQDSEELSCNCGQPSARKTVQKEGVNKGREFYVCARPRDEQCNYFQWADQMDGADRGGGVPSLSNMRGAGTRGGVKRKAPGGGGDGGGEKRQRKCGLCHEPGHTRNRCPMRSDRVSE